MGLKKIFPMCCEIQQYKPMVFFPKKVFAYS